MMILVMLMLVFAVAATATGVMYWFFRRLNRIEEDLWGAKRQEAAKTAEEAATTVKETEA